MLMQGAGQHRTIWASHRPFYSSQHDAAVQGASHYLPRLQEANGKESQVPSLLKQAAQVLSENKLPKGVGIWGQKSGSKREPQIVLFWEGLTHAEKHCRNAQLILENSSPLPANTNPRLFALSQALPDSSTLS